MITRSIVRKTDLVFLTLLFLLSALDFHLEAQALTKPPVPRLASVPDSYAWTIQYQYPQKDSESKISNPYDAAVAEQMRKASPRPTDIETIKTHNNRKEVDKYTDGSETIKYGIGNFLIVDYRVTHAMGIGAMDGAGFNFKEDFYSLDWVEKAEFKGHQSYLDTDCYVYHVDATNGSVEKTAYIAVSTGLPLAVQTPEALLIYTFRPATEEVKLPDNLDSSLQQYIKRQAEVP